MRKVDRAKTFLQIQVAALGDQINMGIKGEEEIKDDLLVSEQVGE